MKRICLLLVFLAVSGLIFAGGQKEEGVEAAVAGVKEAPMLTDMVKKGEIPPLEERLPEDPMVVKPVEELGRYGGTIRFAGASLGGMVSEWQQIAQEPFLITDTYNTKILPNLAKKYEVSDGGRVFTLYLRKGVRWSDGAPFTADDVIFWYEDILLNEELTPSIWSGFKSGGEVMKVTKVDDYTFQVSFKEPYGFFPWILSTQKDTNYYPAHYFKQFHPKYTSKEKLDKMVKEAGFENWSQLFKDKDTNRQEGHPDRPTLRAWKSITEISDASFICERNPYYWKVDTEGRQLPYIDRFRGEVTSRDVWLMKIMRGDVDFNVNGIDTAYVELSLLLENQEKGGYNIYKIGGAPPADPAYFFNHTCNDPVLRDLFNNVTFKAALSLGIDRDEINNSCFYGIGTPSQGHGNAESSYYVESVAMNYTKYDPAKANEMLDSIGLSKRDADGIRLRSDGKPLTLIMDLYLATDDVSELIADYWEKGLGVKTIMKGMAYSIILTRRQTGETQISKSGFYDPVNPWTDQYHALNTKWGPAWLQWLDTDGKEGEEPPKDVKRLHHILKVEGWAAVSDKERDKLMKEVMKLWSDNMWGIGTVGMPYQMEVVKKNLKNIPEKAARWYPGGTVAQQPWQWFYK